MQVIGFNVQKILAERSPEFKKSNINTNIEFTDIDKEKLDLLKDAEALKFSFVFIITYDDAEKSQEKSQDKPQEEKSKDSSSKQGEIRFEGNILLSATKDEAKDITKSWKKKQIEDNFRIPLINFILKKCSVKALSLEEDLNLPIHIPFPRIQKNPQAQ